MEASSRRPRIARGRLRARYEARLGDRRQEFAAAAEAGDQAGRARAAAQLDQVYVSGAYLRRTDPEVLRLRRALSRSAVWGLSEAEAALAIAGEIAEAP